MPRYYRMPAPADQPLAPNPAAPVPAAAYPADMPADGAGGAAQPGVDRSRLPEVGEIADLDFPAIERGRLSNGIEAVFARRPGVPVVRVALSFDAGYSADPADRSGLQSLMAALLDEGTTSLDANEIAEARERLGATITTGAGIDRTTVTLAALKSNLGASLDLMADIVKNPAFAPTEIERLRGQRLAPLAAEMSQPRGIALRILPPLLYGAGHPYGTPFTGSGTPEAVRAITRDDIVGAHDAWIRPDNARIFVVGDTTLAEITPMLEARFGNW